VPALTPSRSSGGKLPGDAEPDLAAPVAAWTAQRDAAQTYLPDGDRRVLVEAWYGPATRAREAERVRLDLRSGLHFDRVLRGAPWVEAREALTAARELLAGPRTFATFGTSGGLAAAHASHCSAGGAASAPFGLSLGLAVFHEECGRGDRGAAESGRRAKPLSAGRA
jgi:hypothetical protein